MFDWLLGFVPPWAWLTLAVAAVLAIALTLKQGGWKWALAASAAGLALFFQSRAYRRGAMAERVKQDAADDHARDVISKNRHEAQAMPEDHLNEKVRGWERH